MRTYHKSIMTQKFKDTLLKHIYSECVPWISVDIRPFPEDPYNMRIKIIAVREYPPASYFIDVNLDTFLSFMSLKRFGKNIGCMIQNAIG